MKDKLNVNISAKSVLTAISILVALYFLILLKSIIILFILGYILAVALRPSVNWLKKKRIPRTIGAIIVLMIFIMVFAITIGFLFPVLFAQLNNLYDNRFELLDSFNAFVGTLPSSLDRSIHQYVNSFPQKVSDYIIGSEILKNVFGVLAGFGGVVMFIVIAAYILIEDSTPINVVKKYWPESSKAQMIDALKAFEIKISQWVRGQIILSVAIGLLTYIGLSLLGVPYALLLSVIAAVTELIPYIGPWIGAFFGVTLAFTVSPLLGLWTGVLYLGIQQFEGAVLVPRVMKKTVGLTPVTTLFVVLAGVAVFGVLGAIIAIPLVAGTKAALDIYLRRING